MSRALLLAVLASTLLLAGCLEGSVDRFWNDLEAEPDYEERSLYHDRAEFSPTGILDPDDPPDEPDDASDRGETTVTVPDGTRSLTVTFTVNFTEAEPEDSPTEPPSTPDGQITISVQGPGGADESQQITYQKSATGGFDFNAPSSGDWTLAYEAQGEGTVEWRVYATVPYQS